MKYLYREGYRYSRIGLGTARFGTLTSERDAFEMLDYFIQNGGNYEE